MADDFITEVNEELRLQRIRAATRRFGVVIAGVVVIGAIGGGIWGWKVHSQKQMQQVASQQYFTAMASLADANHDKATIIQAENTFQNLALHGPTGVRSYAALRLADLKMHNHDSAAALTMWNNVAHDTSAEKPLRDLARYMALNAQINTAPAKDLRSGFEALIQSGGAWVFLAQEGLVALDLRPDATSGQKKEARRLLTQLVESSEAPEGVRNRAQALLETLGDAG
ncbi:tetratricopeptide repeat protein [Swingsia samuiensis]|uniref:tetratricopeptide repeat protein n=1 Tax=Swingsia samuiensis TaxID=1293412 RepID=UPI001FE697C5|nr:tetratricopeptide repeat protein [Swingsia samuiensis]